MTLGIRDKHRGAALHVLLLESRHVLSIRAWAGRLTLVVVLRRALLLAVERFLVAQRLLLHLVRQVFAIVVFTRARSCHLEPAN